MCMLHLSSFVYTLLDEGKWISHIFWEFGIAPWSYGDPVRKNLIRLLDKILKNLVKILLISYQDLVKIMKILSRFCVRKILKQILIMTSEPGLCHNLVPTHPKSQSCMPFQSVSSYYNSHCHIFHALSTIVNVFFKVINFHEI